MPLQLPTFTQHRTKPDKITFSERQRQRKAKALQTEEEEATLGSLPHFRGHRTKPDKVTFSERQRLRKVGELDEGEVDGVMVHRTKDRVTFSERQRQRRKAKPSKEYETLGFIDGPYSSVYSEDTFESPSPSPSPSPSAALSGAVDEREFDTAVEGILQQEEEEEEVLQPVVVPKKRSWLRMGASGKRLLSGAIAGGVSRTVVAPLETIRTHLMVGSTGKESVREVYEWIMETEGWKGLFRGNSLNVLRVAPSKAIELFTYDTVKKSLMPKDGSKPVVPVAGIAGSSAGIASCMLTYPMELVKTRLTIQPDEYRSVIHAFYRIVTEEGFAELYRGLAPSVIGVIPYAGSNYFAYDSLRTLYKKLSKKERIGPLATLCIGSLAGAIASTATFPLEVARKQMQVGAVNGRVVYKGTLDCLRGIMREQGVAGLYKGLGPSCIKLMPAAGISFMCYELLKRTLIDDDE